MLATLALASSLWVAANEAGNRQDFPIPPAAVESIADDTARDLFWVIGTHSADLLATGWAIERCNGACVEGNPIGFNPEARLALKIGATSVAAITMWKLRRDHHGKTATVLRWTVVAINTGLVANNIYRGINSK